MDRVESYHRDTAAMTTFSAIWRFIYHRSPPTCITPKPTLTPSIPYAPYSKSDKISRIADWHDQAELNRNQRAQGGQRRQREAYGAGESNAFGYIHEEDEKSFSVVDSGRAAGARKPGTVNLRPNRGRGGAMRGGAGAGRGRGAPRGGFAGRGRGGGRGGDFRQVSLGIWLVVDGEGGGGGVNFRDRDDVERGPGKGRPDEICSSQILCYSRSLVEQH